ncbi:hypothetical protein YC2023_102739 [Brassica napus]
MGSDCSEESQCAYESQDSIDVNGFQVLPSQLHSQLSLRRESSAPTEGMLNPLWPGLELVMAGTSAEVPIPPDHEARLKT